MSRLVSTVLAMLLAFTLAGRAQAQQGFDAVEIRTEKLTDSVSVLFGRGGNIGVIHGPDGVIMIDDQFAPLTDKILAAIKQLSDQPVRYVLNTHYHGDHTGGNENLGKRGAVIIAHENVRTQMQEGSFIRAFNARTEPQTGKALPVITFTDSLSLHVNGDELQAMYVPNAHTAGDSLIYFRNNNVLHMGDTFFAARLPFIDVDHGGSIDGVIGAARTALSVVNADTKIIPGHGEMQTRADLIAYRDMLIDIRNRVAKLKDDGLSLEDSVAKRPLDDIDARWLASGPGWTDRVVGFIYQSVPPQRRRRR